MTTVINDFDRLKATHRSKRAHFHDNLNLRVHRALSWLQRAELCDDDDGKFIFLWIAFNAAYNNDARDYINSEREHYQQFVGKLVDLDSDKTLYKLVWQQFPSAIRLLLDNKFVFQPYWDFVNGKVTGEDWETQFKAAKSSASHALGSQDTTKVLAIVLRRLYTLRNQLMHGGATYNSKTNRQQLKDGSRLLHILVPTIIELMMSSPDTLWGEACYGVVEE